MAHSDDQSVKVIALFKAAPGMSREEFRRRWVEEHAPLTLQMERLRGYRVNVAIEEQEIEGELPYDGTAELWWDSIEDMRADSDSEAGQARARTPTRSPSYASTSTPRSTLRR